MAASDLDLVDGLVQLSFAVQTLLGEAADAVGLTTVQLRVLGALRDREPLMSELARHLGLDKSSVTGLIDRAERRGLVQRTASSDDGRHTRVTLTADGQRMAAQVAADVSRRLADLVAGLNSRDTAQLRSLATRLVRAAAPGCQPRNLTEGSR